MSATDGTWASQIGNRVHGLVNVGRSCAGGSGEDLCGLGGSLPLASQAVGLLGHGRVAAGVASTTAVDTRG
jgi:hypothetical protein